MQEAARTVGHAAASGSRAGYRADRRLSAARLAAARPRDPSLGPSAIAAAFGVSVNACFAPEADVPWKRQCKTTIAALYKYPREAVSAVRAISTRASKASSGTSAGCNDLLAAQDIPIIKNSDVRVRKRTEAPALVSHILVKRVRGGYRQQHLPTVEVGEWFSTPFMRAACAPEARGRRWIAVDYSFA